MLRRPTTSLPRCCGRRLRRARSWGSDAGRRRAGWRQALSRHPRALLACQRLPGRVGVALHLQDLQLPPPLLPPHLVALVHVVLVDEHLHLLLKPQSHHYYHSVHCERVLLLHTIIHRTAQGPNSNTSTGRRKRECCGGELHWYIERRFTQIQVLLSMEVTVSRFYP